MPDTSIRSTPRRAAPPRGTSSPDASSKRTPRAWAIPAPQSFVAEPPIPEMIDLAPCRPRERFANTAGDGGSRLGGGKASLERVRRHDDFHRRCRLAGGRPASPVLIDLRCVQAGFTPAVTTPEPKSREATHATEGLPRGRPASPVLIDRDRPVLVLRGLAAHGAEIDVLQLLGEFADFTLADRAPVDFDHR